MKKRDIYKILFLICFWECCVIYITYYDAAVLGFESEIAGEHYSFWLTLVTNIVNCFIGSLILGSLEVLVLSKLLRKKPLGISLLIKTTIYILFILFFTSLGTLYLYSFEIAKPMFSNEVVQYYFNFYLSDRVFSVIIFWGTACILALFILQINEKFGQGVLLNFIMGKYHKPKEEARIFMFLDLKSSTTYAEKLGHIKYSQLIQDCFFDITEVVTKHDAEIYQYVGDEVVLSWKLKKGLKNNNCINAYFAYDKTLNDKSEYYENEYGMVPEFKAGVNSGYVTVAEVGELKKELAYHGDVLNTAARIQGKCNEYKSKLLISEETNNQLDKESGFSSELIGDIKLKGKLTSINIYDVRP